MELAENIERKIEHEESEEETTGSEYESESEGGESADKNISNEDEVDLRRPRSQSYCVDREIVSSLTSKNSNYYFMNHGRRGYCHIFVYENYANKFVPPRQSAREDTKLCSKSFKKLGFKVRVHRSYTTEKLHAEITKRSLQDQSDCDTLVIILMTHGELYKGEEVIHTYNGKMLTSDIWKPFAGDKCTTLAGKPKLFFIQACRGDSVDYGVGLEVVTDDMCSKPEPKITECYVIPAHADMMIMYASFAGMSAFKSSQDELNGSVFIHFLAKVLEKDGKNTDLFDLLLTVTRSVALEYESCCPGKIIDCNKQVPQLVSTLMRKLRF